MVMAYSDESVNLLTCQLSMVGLLPTMAVCGDWRPRKSQIAQSLHKGGSDKK